MELLYRWVILRGSINTNCSADKNLYCVEKLVSGSDWTLLSEKKIPKLMYHVQSSSCTMFKTWFSEWV